ncbi:NPCBM/NEW2 domain-containing protein [Nocardiopsis sp. RSe5-2]|uniref:NPCBM/NEW2 domain-containing protein n=1 Tax=Nocardiopsis endophytica TaxID=3018445 RepID=A0ABT4U988_9ACTN|nr:NPCBM/NEW2 domain-containing protein [Nocardiopsis endophytica]MDA2813520.1 NPCBM/NEW2 domain-containing protein [Nocardiopsis endophytica]
MPLSKNVTVPTALLTALAGVVIGTLVTGTTVYFVWRDWKPPNADAPRPEVTVTAEHTVTATPTAPGHSGTAEGEDPEEGPGGPPGERMDDEPLNGLEPVDGNAAVEWGKPMMNGERRDGSMMVELCGVGEVIAYDIGRDWKRLETTVGLADGVGASDGSVTFEVIGDGERLAHTMLALGEEEELSVDVEDVLRLELSMADNDCLEGHAVWVDPVLYA